jgi:hypothetical protein
MDYLLKILIYLYPGEQTVSDSFESEYGTHVLKVLSREKDQAEIRLIR